MLKKFTFSLILLFIWGFSFGHGDLHERIIKTTKEIESNPDSSYLYFKRGKLYYHHENFKLALKDLKTAELKGHASSYHKLFIAKTSFALEDYTTTLLYLDKILLLDNNYVKAIKLKAQLLFDLGRYEESAISYEELISKSEKSFPDDYIMASKSWFSVGDDVSKNNAHKILDKGIEDLGSIFSILAEKRNLYAKSGDVDNAIRIYDQIISMSNRKEGLYFEAFEFAIQNNRIALAEYYLNNAYTSVNKLPIRIKNNSAMRELQANIKAGKIIIKNEKS